MDRPVRLIDRVILWIAALLFAATLFAAMDSTQDGRRDPYQTYSESEVTAR